MNTRKVIPVNEEIMQEIEAFQVSQRDTKTAPKDPTKIVLISDKLLLSELGDQGRVDVSQGV